MTWIRKILDFFKSKPKALLPIDNQEESRLKEIEKSEKKTKLTEKSLKKLATCDERLQKLVTKVAEKTSVMVLCGHRGFADQMKAYAKGHSKLIYPKSEHNKIPARAVDLAPEPLDWKNKQAFIELSKAVKESARELDIPIEWGGDWKSFVDMPHYQLPKDSK